MEWIDYRKDKPKSDICAVVANDKGWMFNVKAMYHSAWDTWTLDDPRHSQDLTLDVTHYVPLPTNWPRRIK